MPLAEMILKHRGMILSAKDSLCLEFWGVYTSGKYIYSLKYINCQSLKRGGSGCCSPCCFAATAPAAGCCLLMLLLLVAHAAVAGCWNAGWSYPDDKDQALAEEPGAPKQQEVV